MSTLYGFHQTVSYTHLDVYKRQLENAGLVISAVNDEHGLVEVVELPEHPFFLSLIHI